MLIITSITTEYQPWPLGLDERAPRFSWTLVSDRNNIRQTSWHLVVKQSGSTVWDSGMRHNDTSHLVQYAGKPLEPCTLYEVFLKVTDNEGCRAEATGGFETGLMDPSVIQAEWITHGYSDDIQPCPVYEKRFTLRGKPKQARVYASALGVYELHINGRKVGDACLAPGWTNYKQRLQYQTHDITDILENVDGQENVLHLVTANGWYKGELGFVIQPNHYGTRTAAIAQVTIRYEDGSEETFGTDTSWQYGSGPIRYAELYHGETIDHTKPLTMEGQAKPHEHTKDTLTAQECEPVRVTKRIKPIATIITPKQEVVLDFGQNLVGVVEARLNCAPGTAVTMKHAEVLDKDGNFYTANLRAARATDTFICAGGKEVFTPSFTFHGFRYLQVIGLGENVNADDFTALVLHSDLKETGFFECSDPDVTRLQQNIQWGQRGNYLDIPTDCNQRDERLGWTGDTQVFAATACYNMQSVRFLSKWYNDLRSEQTLEHGVPGVIPNILGENDGSAAWGDAATIVPWALYQAYGDKVLLGRQYLGMKLWVEYIRSKAKNNLWQTGFQYGDWLALDKEEMSDRIGATDVYLLSSAFYAKSTQLVAQAAKVLGKKEDAKEYEALHKNIVAAFQREYITATGRLVSETQTACVLALHFDLAQEMHRARIVESLQINLSRHNDHLVTGFVGTPYLCAVLSDNGLHELAGTVFMQHDHPSWLYAVGLGATTIWERWNSMKPDGTFDESGMNSFNHYAYGAIGEWMYTRLAGINIASPGYKNILIKPRPIRGITWVNAHTDTPYGRVSVSWKFEHHMFTADISIPVNTCGVIHLPGWQEGKEVGSGNYHFEYTTELELEKPRFSMSTTLGELINHPIARAMFEEHMPGMADNPMIGFVLDKPIAAITGNMPPEGVAFIEMVINRLNRKKTDDL